MKVSDKKPGLILFTGKGGVGKSTCTIALSCYLAAQQEKVRILSMDPAHSIRLLLDEISSRSKITRDKSPLSHIRADEPDFEKLTQKWLSGISSQIKERYKYFSALNLDKMADTIEFSPGVREHIMCRVLWSKLKEEVFEGITLMDMPATASLHGLIHYLLSSQKWLESLSRLHKSIQAEEKSKENIKKESEGGKQEELGMKIISLGDMLEGIPHILRDSGTFFCCVLNPERLSMSEASSTQRVLEKAGIGLRLLILNKWTEESKNDELLIELKKNLDREAVKIPPSDFESDDLFQTYVRIGEIVWKSLYIS